MEIEIKKISERFTLDIQNLLQKLSKLEVIFKF